MIDLIIGMITPEVLATPITVSNQPDRPDMAQLVRAIKVNSS